jgi:hypothetical protein
MKDDQGTNIINPETIKIIRNLRGKALMEEKTRDHYLDMMVRYLRKYHNGNSDMELIENYGQKWCFDRGIIGYEYITNITLTLRKL